MKFLFPAIFIVMGVTFLLVSTVFYPPITQWLHNLQEQNSSSVPAFWNLSLVLKFVKIIFLVVGIFLTLFGIGMFWFKKPWL